MRNSSSGGVGAKRLGEVGSRSWKSRIECSQDLTAGSSTNSRIPTTMSIPVTMSSFYYYEYSCHHEFFLLL